jgi:hypothetical protein
MKKRLLLLHFILLSILFGYAAGTYNITLVLWQKYGSLSFIVKNKAYKAEAMLTKAASKGYTINTIIAGESNSLAIVLPDIATGKYTFGTGDKQSSMFVNNTNYLLNDGYINTRINGKQLSGNFKVKYYSADGKGGYNKIPSGEISGTFEELIIP